MNLTQRKDTPKGYYYLTMKNGVKYSVVDFGTTLKTMPEEYRKNLFNGWEAILIKNDGILNCDKTYRKPSKEALLEELRGLNIDTYAVNVPVIERTDTLLSKIFHKPSSIKLSPVNIVEDGGRVYTLRADGHGTITFYFKVKDGRATCHESIYCRENKTLSLNVAATKEEVKHLISVLVTLRGLMD